MCKWQGKITSALNLTQLYFPVLIVTVVITTYQKRSTQNFFCGWDFFIIFFFLLMEYHLASSRNPSGSPWPKCTSRAVPPWPWPIYCFSNYSSSNRSSEQNWKWALGSFSSPNLFTSKSTTQFSRAAQERAKAGIAGLQEGRAAMCWQNSMEEPAQVWVIPQLSQLAWETGEGKKKEKK